MITGTQELIRDINRNLVLELLVNKEPMSRANLSKLLHLTKATISNIVQDLLKDDLVIELGSEQTPLGRKPILLDFHSTCGYAISIDVAVDHVLVMTCDLKGQSCKLKEYPFPKSLSLLSYLRALIQDTIQLLPPSTYGVVGICIGIYGVVCENKILFTPYYPLPDSNLGALLEEIFQVPVRVENEANLSVLGESAFHYNHKDMVHINVHDGVGMGILIHGQLYTGHDGYAGEFGHTILFPHGKLCPCGNHGCFEQYASEKAILTEYARRTGCAQVHLDDFLADYRHGSSIALEMIDLFVDYMTIAMTNVLNTFNVDLIVLNSSFSNYIPGLHARIQSALSTLPHRSFRIIASSLQDTSALLGGVCISAKNFLGISQLQIQS